MRSCTYAFDICTAASVWRAAMNVSVRLCKAASYTMWKNRSSTYCILRTCRVGYESDMSRCITYSKEKSQLQKLLKLHCQTCFGGLCTAASDAYAQQCNLLVWEHGLYLHARRMVKLGSHVEHNTVQNGFTKLFICKYSRRFKRHVGSTHPSHE